MAKTNKYILVKNIHTFIKRGVMQQGTPTTTPNIYVRPLPTKNQIEFWWQQPISTPDDAPITYYQLACSSIGFVRNLSSSAYQTRVSGLQSNTKHQFTLAAGNEYNLSAPVAFRLVETGTKPESITVVSMNMVTRTSANLSWTYTHNPEAAAILGFAVYAIPSTPTLSTVYISAEPHLSTAYVTNIVNDTYTFSVFAVNDAGWVALRLYNTIIANTTFIETLPTAQTNISTTRLSYSSFTLSWQPNPTASYYTYEIDGSPIVPLNASLNTATFSNLTGSTIYSVILNSINNVGSTPSAPFTVTTLIPPASQFSNIFIDNVQSTELTVNWSGAVGASAYVFRFNNIVLTPIQTTASSATFSGLTPETFYSITITASNVSGSTTSAPTTVYTAPLTPTNLYVTDVAPTSLTINWTGSPGAIYYNISIDGGLTYPFNSPSSPYVITNLSGGVTYNIVVASVNNYGFTPSLPIAANTGPTSPANITLTNASTTGFSLSWTAGTDAASYNISLNGGTTYVLNTANVYYDFTGLTSGTEYLVIIQSLDIYGTTANSPVFRAITVPSLPSPISLTSYSPTGFTLNWTLVQGVSTYTVVVNSDPLVNLGPSTATYVITGLNSGSLNTTTIGASNRSGSSQSTIDVLTLAQAPANLQADSITTSSFTASWVASQSATMYYLSLFGGGTYPFSTTTTSYEFSTLTAATTYNLFVVANNPSGDSPGSALRVLTNPNAPTGLTPSQITQTSFTLSWSQTQGATYYSVSINSGQFINVSVTSFAFTGLASGTINEVSVRAYNSSGFSQSSLSVLTRAETPQNVRSSDVFGTSFTITWDSCVGAAIYKISLDNGDTYPYTTTSTTYDFTGMPYATTFRVIVASNNSSGDSLSSTLTVLTRPAPPANINATNITTTGFTVRWTISSGALSYNINVNNTGFIKVSNDPAINYYAVTGLATGSDNTIVVESTNSSGSTPSSSFTFTTLSSAPASVTATNITLTSFVVNWTASSGATSYSVNINSSGFVTVPGGAAASSYTFTGLTPGFSNTVIVQANNGSGSTQAPSITVPTLPSAPANPTASSITQTSFTVNWTLSFGATNYSVNINDAGFILVPGGSTAISYAVSGLVPGFSNTVIVRANNDSGSTEASSITVPTLPAPPTPVTATNITQTTFTVNWTLVSGATSYSVKVNTAAFVEVSGGASISSYDVSGLVPGFVNTVIVRANNSSGSTEAASISVPTVPAAPTSVTASSITQTSFTVNWTLSSGATSYSVNINNAGFALVPGGSSVSSYAVSGLVPGFSNTVIVRANNDSGSTEAASITVPTLPVAPAAVNATSITTTSFTVNWTASSGATSYSVNVNSAGFALVSGGSSISSYAVSGLVPGFSNTVIVRANNASGSTEANSITVPTLPAAPSSVNATSITTTSFRVNWTASSGATGYSVKVNSLAFVDVSTLYYDVTGLEPGFSNTVIVRANNASGSTEAAPITVPTLPAAPATVTATNITQTSFTVNWTLSSGATTYSVNINSAGFLLVPGGSSVTSYDVTGLGAASLNTVIVRANNASGSTEASSISVRTLAPAPTSVNATSITQTSFTVNWTLSSGATSYSVNINSGGFVLVSGGATVNSYNVSGMSAGTTNTVIVQANNDTGSSPASSINVLTLPPAPGSVTASSITQTSFIVNWTASLSATTYSIKINTADFVSVIPTTYTVINLSSGSTNTIIVAATNATGTTQASSITVCTAPAAPTNIRISYVTSTSFTVNWATVTGATSYGVSVNSGSFISVSPTFYAVTGLLEGSSNTIIVRATNFPDPSQSATQSTQSSQQTYTTLPGTPTSIQVSNLTPSGFVISWSGATGATSYLFYANSIKITPSSYDYSARTATFTSLTSSTTYDLTVSAINSAGPANSTSAFFNLILWLDALDPGLTLSNGATTTTWYDKSGLANTATTSTAITYNSTAISSAYPAFIFTGSQKLTGYIYNVNETISIFAVFYMNSNSSVNTRLISLGQSGQPDNNNVGYLAFQRQNGFSRGLVPNRNGIVTPSNEAPSYSNPFLIEAWADGTNLNATIQKGAVTNIVQVTSSGSFNISSYAIGSSLDTTSNFLNGAIAELLVYNSVLSSGDRKNIEGYLSWKWGIQANLPSSNPNAPTAGATAGPTFGLVTTTLPAAPTNVTITNQGTAGFTVSWTNAQRVSSYKISLNNGVSYAYTDILSTPYTISDLTPGNAYDVVVASVYFSGSTPANAVTGRTAPSAPTGLTASSITTSGFTVSWSASTGASSYNVSTNNGASFTSAGNVLTYAFTGLSSGTTYDVIVQAQDSYGLSTNSTAISVITKPAAPSNITQTAITQTTFTINWQAVTGAVSYSVSVNSGTFNTVGSATSYDVTVTNPGDSATVSIQATNTSGSTASANTTYYTLPATPTNLTITNVTNNSFTLSWSAANGNTTYFISNDNGANYSFTTTSTTYLFTSLLPSTVYTLIVKANNSVGYSPASASVTTTTKPDPPTNVQITSIGPTGFTVGWTAGSGASSYQISVNNGSSYAYTGISSSPYTISNLVAGTTYQVVVASVFTSGITAATAVSVRTGPTAPTNLAVSNVSTSAFTITWSASPEATSYNVSSNGGSTFTAAGNVLTYTFSSLSSGTSYTVVIQAEDSNGIKTNSSAFSVITLPAVPSNITQTDITQTTFTINWQTVTGAASYGVSVNSGAFNTLSNSTTSFAVTVSYAGDSALISVRATNASGSSASTATTYYTLPATPQNLAVTSTDTTSISLSWSAANGALTYYISNDNGATYPFSTAATTYTLTGLSSATTYTIYVKAYNSVGYSPASSSVQGTTTNPSPPGALTLSSTATNITSTGFTISWSASSGATTYYVSYDNGSNYTSVGNVTTYTFTGLTPQESRYYVIVKAENSIGFTLSNTVEFGAPSPITTTGYNSTTLSSFQVTWYGATGASSFSYRLNGNLTTPASSGINGTQYYANFTGLLGLFKYSVIIFATNSYGTVQSSPYLPLTSNLIMNLDAFDISNQGTSTTFANNTAVSVWKDKINASADATPRDVSSSTGYYSPSTNNGHPAIFISSGNYLSGSISITGNQLTIFAVVNMSSNSNENARVISFGNQDYPYAGFRDYFYANTMLLARYGFNPQIQSYRNYVAAIPPGQTQYATYIHECVVDGTTRTSVSLVDPNTYNSASTADNNGNFNILVYSIGAQYFAQYVRQDVMEGYLCEILIYNTALSLDQRYQVEAYLSTKWGLQDNLYTSNPYKNTGIKIMTRDPGTEAGSRGWFTIACSTDGQTVVAGSNSQLMVSFDAGATWFIRTPLSSGAWLNVCVSADGTKIVTGNFGGNLYKSTNAGETWVTDSTIGTALWHGAASSSDGNKLTIASISGGRIYTSTNAGASWVARTVAGLTTGEWYGLAGSADGNKLVTANNGGYIYTSTNAGADWVQRTAAGGRAWYGFASSADGNKLVGGTNSGTDYIYTSTDSGATWVARGLLTPGIGVYVRFASSSDGTKLITGKYSSTGYIYTSSDSGVTWVERTAAGQGAWAGFSSSSDGTFLTAGMLNSYMWRSSDSGATWAPSVSSPLTPVLTASNIIATGFTVNWGGTGATSFTTSISPSAGTNVVSANAASGSATWSGLTTNTTYTVTVTATIGANSVTSSSVSVTPSGPGVAAGIREWRGINCSSNGQIAFVVLNGFMYVSYDAGATWYERTSAGSGSYRYYVAASADGTKLVTGNYLGNIYTSTDIGVTLVERTGAGTGVWVGFASSSDGNNLVTGNNNNGYIYTSTNAGATWVVRTGPGTGSWNGFTSSSDGTKLAATKQGNYIYTSTNSGVDWVQRTSSGTGSWWGIAGSSDGNKLVTGWWQGGSIYTSTDAGASWVQRTGAGTGNWIAFASSSDGNKLVTGNNNNGYIYTSTDAGATWLQRTGAGTGNWYGVTSSSDGTILIAASQNGAIWRSSDSGATWTPSVSTPVAPVLTASNITTTGFKVNWGGTGATSFTYSISPSAGTYVASANAASGSVTWSGLTMATSYTVTVTATIGANSTNSAATTFTTDTTVGVAVLLRGSNYSGTGSWLDESGNNRNATLENGTIAKNATGTALVFNGSTSWTFPNVAVGNLWSVSVWYKNTDNLTYNASLVSQINVSNRVNLTIIGAYTANNFAGAFIDQSFRFGTPISLVLGAWANIQVVWDGTNFITYVNGSLIGSGSSGTGPAIDSGGAYVIGRNPSAAYFILGEIGDVRIYSYARTQAQVTAFYNATVGSF